MMSTPVVTFSENKLIHNRLISYEESDNASDILSHWSFFLQCNRTVKHSNFNESEIRQR